MSKVTEAFGSEKRKRLMAASLRNKLDVTTLDTTLAPAIAVAEEHVENSKSSDCHVTAWCPVKFTVTSVSGSDV